MNDQRGHPAAPKGALTSSDSDHPLSVAMIGPVPAHWGGQKWTGGVANHIYGLTRGLAEEPVEICVLADNTVRIPRFPAGELPGNLSIRPIQTTVRSLVGIPKTSVPPNWRKTYPKPSTSVPRHHLGYLLRILSRAQNIQSFVLTTPHNLIHVHHARIRLFACWEVLEIQQGLLTTVHSVNKLSDDSPQWLKELIITNYRRANRFIAVSSFVRDEMVAHGADPGKITVIPNGVDTDLFAPGSKEAARDRLQLPADSLLVLFTGSLTVRKGVDILLRAFQTAGRAVSDRRAWSWSARVLSAAACSGWPNSSGWLTV